MDAAILHHDTGKLWRQVIIGLVFTVASAGLCVNGSKPEHHGRGVWLVSLLGPTGTLVLMATFGLACAVLSIMALRLIVSQDSAAAIADADGVTIRSLFATKRYAWCEITVLKVREVNAGARTQHLLVVAADGRRGVTLSNNTLEGGPEALAVWLGQAAASYQAFEENERAVTARRLHGVSR